ncbi:MAG: alanine racemase [Candidatus Coproplasma sp.]
MQKTLSVINLSAIRSNALKVKSLIGGKFFYAVVKADAYGHGATEVAKELEDVADGFCVAIVDEASELRISGITKPILVLAPPLDTDDIQKLKFYNLQATVTDERSAKLCRGLPFQIAVNTGMNRYGCNIDELNYLLSVVEKESIVGVYSHLYCADNEKICREQLSVFKQAERAVKKFAPGAIAHLSASGGILRGEEYLCDGVRCGLMLYGYTPFGFKKIGLTPALKVYARLAQQTKVFGKGVGYNVADKKYQTLYTYRLGYADGFFRNVPLGEKTLCMDAFISSNKGDYLPVFTDAEEYSARCGTISYEVLCSVTARSQRIYERRAEI